MGHLDSNPCTGDLNEKDPKIFNFNPTATLIVLISFFFSLWIDLPSVFVQASFYWTKILVKQG